MSKFFKISFNKDIFFLGLGNIIRLILVISYSRLMTLFLSFEELANYYIVFSIYTFFSFIIIGSVGNYINRKTIEWYEENNLKSALKQIFIKFLFPLSIFSFLPVFVYSFYVYDSIKTSIIICALVFTLILFKTFNETVYPIFNIIRKNIKYVYFLLTFNLLNLLFSVLFVYFFGYNFEFWMLGLICSNLIVALLAWKSLFINSKSQNTLKLNIKELYNFSSNILIGHILIWFLTDGFRFFAKNKFDTNSLGILLLGLMVSTQIFSLIEHFLNQIIYPRYLKKISTNNFNERSVAFNKYFNKVLPIVFLSAIFMSLSSAEILSILIDKSKINNTIIFVFQVAIWIEFFRILINSLKNITTSEFQTQKLILPYFIGCLIFILGIILYDFNVKSLSALLLLSYFLISIICIKMFNKIIKIKLDILNIIKLFGYLIPIFILLFLFDKIIITILCSFYFMLIIYNFLNKDYLNEII
jgi:O-antigen/teichoic acid export membrane protein